MKHINLGDAIVLLEDVRGIRLIKNGKQLEVIYTDNATYTYDVSGFDSDKLIEQIWNLIQGITAEPEW
jgi:hypothetical protein